MNIEAKPGSELAIRSSYENFVIELAEGMKVDENVYLPKKEGEFDYEDIYSWIRAVDFRNGKPPKIERTIKEDRGLKTLELKTQELDEITDENKKLSSESQLYAMAVTEAKMAVVAELAEDTYPAVRYQINEIRREMQKVRQEIFGVEDREKSVKEILDRMVRSKKIQAATALVIAAMILTACSNPTQINASETVNPTRPVATEVSPTPIFATPAETATPAEVETNPEYAEIDQRVRDFLNEEGKYTDEELAKLPHMGFDDRIVLEGNYLGIIQETVIRDNTALINDQDWDGADVVQVLFQGIYLGGVLENNRVVLLVGTLNRDGNRVVVPFGRNVNIAEGKSFSNDLSVYNYEGGTMNVRTAGMNKLDLFADGFNQLADMHDQTVVVDCYGSDLLVTPQIQEAINIVGPSFLERIKDQNSSVPKCKTLFNKTFDLRGDPRLLVGADENFQTYDVISYSGFESILQDSNSDIEYDIINFVRR